MSCGHGGRRQTAVWPCCLPPLSEVVSGSRKDTWDDLTLFMIFNLMLMFVAGIIKVTLVDGPDGESKPFALALYEVRPRSTDFSCQP